jgi:glycerophosphoryl diester phosphodiesterase
MPTPLPDTLSPGTIFAHRGDRVAERENTIAAFRSAAEAGAAGVELDVRRTADGHLVVHHDAVIGGLGAICEIELSHLRRNAPWLPTLTEAVAACTDIWVNVEVKNHPDDIDWDPDREVADMLGDVIEQTGIIVSSFDWETVAATSAVGWPSAYLVDSGLEAAIARAGDAGIRAVNPRADLVDSPTGAELVAAAAADGLWLMTWTVNDEDQGRRLRDLGVQVIFTDDPRRMTAALA